MIEPGVPACTPGISCVKLNEVAPVQRQVHNLAGIDHRTHRGVLGLQQHRRKLTLTVSFTLPTCIAKSMRAA